MNKLENNAKFNLAIFQVIYQDIKIPKFDPKGRLRIFLNVYKGKSARSTKLGRFASAFVGKNDLYGG